MASRWFLMGAAALAFAATLTPAHANEAPVTCAVEIRNETPALQPAFQEALSQWNQALAGSGLQFVDAPSGPNVVTVRTATNEQMVAASGRNTSPPSGLGHGTGPNGPGRVLINENSYQPGAATDRARGLSSLGDRGIARYNTIPIDAYLVYLSGEADKEISRLSE